MKVLHSMSFISLLVFTMAISITGCREGPSVLPQTGGPPLPNDQVAKERPSFEGTLGGRRVRIPNHFINLMEFSGETTDWNHGPQSPQARAAGTTRDIASFGFDVKYPQMDGLSTDELKKDYQQRSPKGNQWMRVSITSGDMYRSNAVDVMAKNIRRPSTNTLYDIAESDVHGLVRHVARGIDIKTGEPLRFHFLNPDVYIARDEGGQPVTVIHCTNKITARRICDQHFLLEPDAHAYVEVRYSRDMLPNWEEIQGRTRNLILGFRIAG